ncbi:MAG: 50S ribosomal protein L19, partial [Candidatus Roizmanbacteria bacterium]
MANSVVVHEQEARVGDTVKISYAYKDKEKEKLQDFEGILMGVQGMGVRKNIVVRKMTRSKVGVERIFPILSPNLKSFTVMRKSKNTRAKIFY